MTGLTTCIIIIGSEITRGIIQDTNSHWLARRLTSIGIDVRRVIVVPDDMSEITWALRACIEACNIVITTGGLGFTSDDITIPVIAESLGLKRVYSPAVYEMVKNRLRGRIPEHLEVVYPPEGAEPLLNTVGVSPGFHLVYNGRHLFILPGVPAEMENIFEGEVMPRLARLTGTSVTAESLAFLRTLKVITKHEVEAEVDKLLEPLRVKYKWAYIKTHARKPVEITIQVYGANREDIDEKVNTLLRELRKILEIDVAF
ncbi:competence/damage-inducible protein A [Desulfurococcus amylolyticus]|uniref:Competence/damage-inducible protein cinA n=1 Tax=Desulfurococcus amylolyticus DSM 16532 TaxID=768672 RepID=I3XS95_DESAM|nr:competence/damage-inducible protein A [Desulfurococcus amylolyticus]AFL66819.1 competence/damage-inducible protein cinA [Desulfurococcus amylolyticus DSM 16532]